MKAYITEIKWAGFILLFNLLWIGIERLFGFHDSMIRYQSLFSLLSFVPIIFMFYLALKEKKSVFFGDQMQWQDGFTSGIVMAIAIAIFAPIVLMIAYNFIAPDFFAKQTSYVIDTDMMTKEQAETMFNLRTYIMQSTFGGMMRDIVICGVLSYFVVKK